MLYNQMMRLGFIIAAVALSPILSLSAHESDSHDEVNVYSYRQSFLLKPIFKKFTHKYDINVNLISAPKGLVERISAEGRHSPADLLLTSNFGRLQDAVDAGITRPVKDTSLQQSIPKNLRDPNQHWFPLTLRARVLYVSKARIEAGAVTDYAQLKDPEWRGRICTRSGTHDYNLALFGSFIHHWGAAKTRFWLEGVKVNLARKPQGNDRAQVKAISEGLCDIAIGNSYYYGLMLANGKQRAWADAVNIVFPNQNGDGTHINISGMAMMKNAPNSAHALTLMRFMLSQEIQQFYAEKNHEYPVRSDVKWAETVRSWGEFKQDKARLAEIYNLRKQAFILVNKTKFNH